MDVLEWGEQREIGRVHWFNFLISQDEESMEVSIEDNIMNSTFLLYLET